MNNGSAIPEKILKIISGKTRIEIFNNYTKILNDILQRERNKNENAFENELVNWILPSDDAFRYKQYMNLLSIQRKICSESHPGKPKVTNKPEEPKKKWENWPDIITTLISNESRANAPPPVEMKANKILCTWNVEDVVKAASLLLIPRVSVAFEDQREMKRVFSLIYDVYRYKNPLTQALTDVKFFSHYPENADNPKLAWLFIMDLANRRWMARDKQSSLKAQECFSKCDPKIAEMDKNIWDQKVHLAAALARIRIQYRALLLSDLLPEHLRDDKVTASEPKECITGWVNMFKVKNLNNFIRRLNELGYSYSSSRQLCASEYRFDRVCQRFITIRPPRISTPEQAMIFLDRSIVPQEREFCEGASMFCRALIANSLRGHVAQTHATSPQATAYLAAQLADVSTTLSSRLGTDDALVAPTRLYVFGAGTRLDDYVKSLQELGVITAGVQYGVEAILMNEHAVIVDKSIGTYVIVIGEAIHEQGGSPALEGVVAALATPPNSYSAVTDPVDLICSRGGDLELLEILTETDLGEKGKKRVESILEEQRKTLKSLVAKPQIQLIMYETHSILAAENESMVQSIVQEANNFVKLKHAKQYKNFETKQCPTKIARMELVPTNADVENVSYEKSYSIKTEATGLIEEIYDYVPTKDSNKTIHETIEDEPNIIKPNHKYNPPSQIPASNTLYDFSNKDPMKNSIKVPKKDLFEIKRLPHLGNGLDINLILERDGCYLGLIQRKEITRMDPKFMIDVAEERGVFGALNAVANAAPIPYPKERTHRKKRKASMEVDRIAAPTHASLLRSRQQQMDDGPPMKACCSRHERHLVALKGAGRTSMCSSCANKRKRRYYVINRPIETPEVCYHGTNHAARPLYPLNVCDLKFCCENDYFQNQYIL